jgi:hypothetical protein
MALHLRKAGILVGALFAQSDFQKPACKPTQEQMTDWFALIFFIRQ